MAKARAQVAFRLKRLLSAKGISAEKLAYEIGMSKGFLYAFLRGEKNMTIDSLERLAEGLDVKIRDFFPES